MVNLWRVASIGVLCVLLSACQPAPTQTAALPTLAMVASLTPIPPTATASHTPPPTPTAFPTQTPLPVLTATPRPTQPPTPDRRPEDCQETLRTALESLSGFCANANPNELCYGAAQVDATSILTISSDRLSLRGLGSQIPIDGLQSVNSSAYSSDGQLWGASLARLTHDANGALPEGTSLGVAILGGVTLQNDVPNFVTQEQANITNPNPPPLEYPLTRVRFSALPSPQACPFMLHGMVMQAPTNTPVRMTLNQTDLIFGGTVLIRMPQPGLLSITTLEGETLWRVGTFERRIPSGAYATIGLDGALAPLGVPSTLAVDEGVLLPVNFNRIRPIFALLNRPLTEPPTFDSQTLAQLNDYSGTWTVNARVDFIAGMYATEEAITTALINDVLQSCSWQGAHSLGVQTPYTFTLTVDTAQTLMQVAGNFPMPNFPAQLPKDPATTDTFSGTFSLGAATFAHTFQFTSPTTFIWNLQASGVGTGKCQEVRISGVGTRN